MNYAIYLQVVLWDKIILRGENALLDYRSMNTKYYFWDDGNGLLNHQNVTMTLSWNIIPNAGNLPRYVRINKYPIFVVCVVRPSIVSGLCTGHRVVQNITYLCLLQYFSCFRIMSSGKHSFAFPDSYTTSRVM